MMVAEAVESFERKVIALVGVGMSMIMILVGVLIIMIWVGMLMIMIRKGVRQDDDINL